MLQWFFAICALGFAIAPVLRIEAVPLALQPYPDTATYADSAFQIANGNGFRVRIFDRDMDVAPAADAIYPSRFPPGFALALAPFVKFGSNDPTDAQGGARAAALLLVLALFSAAWVVGGPVAAGLAAVATAVSPFAQDSARLVMSDAFGAALTLLVLAATALALTDRLGRRAQLATVVLAGAIAGYGVVVRFSGITVLGSLLIVLLIARRPRLAAAVALGALPFLIFLGAYQWTEFGSPLRTGYDYWVPDVQLFDAGNVFLEEPVSEGSFIFSDRSDGDLMGWTCPCPLPGSMGQASNAIFYPAVLLGLYWVFFPPLLSVFGVWELVRRRREPLAWFAGLVVASGVVVALVFSFQGARFVAPVAYVLLVFAATAVARWLSIGATWALRRIQPDRRADELTEGQTSLLSPWRREFNDGVLCGE